jgi:hypothetical protein
MEDPQIILNVVILVVLLLTLMMAWASHRKLKTHQYYLQALIEHEVLEDIEREDAAAAVAAATPTTTATPSASSLKGSSGEMCNDLRSPMGGKIYNRDCLKTAITGSTSAKLKPNTAGVPNLNTVIQSKYMTSG